VGSDLGGVATTTHGGRPGVAPGPNQAVLCSRIKEH
jgi:hypothetical protein